jgi:hypothetical protein
MKTTLLLGALLALSACADQYGHVDPVRTGLMGAAVGGGLGLVGGAIARDQQGQAERRRGSPIPSFLGGRSGLEEVCFRHGLGEVLHQ